MPLRAIFTFLYVSVSLVNHAQRLTNLTASQQGNFIVVDYHLEGEQGHAYNVTLYSSINSFTTPLKLVQGDVNEKRLLSGSHSIRWNALAELKAFDGDMSFELRAVPAAALFQNVKVSVTKVKRGKPFDLSWSSAHANDAVKVELAKGSSVVAAGSTTSGKVTYTTSRKMKTGNYTILLSSGKETTTVGSITVKPRFPLLVKVLPVLAVGVVIASWPDPKETFPEPPDLTGN